jgi:hypothetical protein
VSLTWHLCPDADSRLQQSGFLLTPPHGNAIAFD